MVKRRPAAPDDHHLDPGQPAAVNLATHPASHAAEAIGGKAHFFGRDDGLVVQLRSLRASPGGNSCRLPAANIRSGGAF
jgi:hypothetical protein